jgi:hypothetical protein
MASTLPTLDGVAHLVQDESTGAYRVTTSTPESVIPGIYRLAERLGLTVSSIYIAETTLEDAFINLVTDDQKGNGGVGGG